MRERILIHCDLDAFYASVETLHHNLDSNIPLTIGSDPKHGQGRGIVSTCNYAAREFGVRSAMPISEAWRRCPGKPLGNALYHRGAHRLYRRASNRVMAILSEHADKFEQASIDEAYLDVTEVCEGDWSRAESLSRNLQKLAETHRNGQKCAEIRTNPQHFAKTERNSQTFIEKRRNPGNRRDS